MEDFGIDYHESRELLLVRILKHYSDMRISRLLDFANKLVQLLELNYHDLYDCINAATRREDTVCRQDTGDVSRFNRWHTIRLCRLPCSASPDRPRRSTEEEIRAACWLAQGDT